MKKLFYFTLLFCLFCFISSRIKEDQRIRDLKILERICYTFRNEMKKTITAILLVVYNRSNLSQNSIEEEGRLEMFNAYSGKMKENSDCKELSEKILDNKVTDQTKATYFSHKDNIPKAFKGIDPSLTIESYVFWKIEYP